MAEKKFTQNELNRFVAFRLKRERERTIKEYENSLKRCMAAVHLTLYQEMCSLKNELNAEMKDPISLDFTEKFYKKRNASSAKAPAEMTHEGGERQ